MMTKLLQPLVVITSVVITITTIPTTKCEDFDHDYHPNSKVELAKEGYSPVCGYLQGSGKVVSNSQAKAISLICLAEGDEKLQERHLKSVASRHPTLCSNETYELQDNNFPLEQNLELIRLQRDTEVTIETNTGYLKTMIKELDKRQTFETRLYALLNMSMQVCLFAIMLLAICAKKCCKRKGRFEEPDLRDIQLQLDCMQKAVMSFAAQSKNQAGKSRYNPDTGKVHNQSTYFSGHEEQPFKRGGKYASTFASIGRSPAEKGTGSKRVNPPILKTQTRFAKSTANLELFQDTLANQGSCGGWKDPEVSLSSESEITSDGSEVPPKYYDALRRAKENSLFN